MNLMHGDCLELMSGISNQTIDLVLTDPPYGTIGGMGKSINSKTGQFKRQQDAAKWDNVIDIEAMWQQLYRIVRPNGKDFENFNHFYNAMRREYRIRAEAAKPAAIHELELQAAHLRNEIAAMEADFMRPLKRMAKRTAGLFDLSRQGIAAISNTPTNPSVAELQREFLQEQAAKRRRTQERTLDKLLPETEQLIERMKARQTQ